ncbi:MAG: hypothetical protein ACI4KR_12145 [Ruminiclostridium sp.]
MHNQKGNEYYFTAANVDAMYTNCVYFMENVVGYPWIIEEISSSEKYYYLDDTKKIGFAVYKTTATTTTGIYVLCGGAKSTKSLMSLYGAGNTYFLYSHVSSGEDVVYIGCYNTANKYLGYVAAKDVENNWCVLYADSAKGYIATHNGVIDLNYNLGFSNYSDYINCYFSIAKAANGITGAEFGGLYSVLSCPIAPANDVTSGAQSVYIEADGKTYRLVALNKNYITLAFPVSD